METIRLLIAEDNQTICELLRCYFDACADIELVAVAPNGTEAIEKIRALQPDVILLDLIMPGTDGFYVLEQLSDPSIEKRPEIIVVSGIGRDDIIQRAIRLGAQYYIVKPFKLDLLYNRIHDTMGSRTLLPAIQDAASAQDHSPSEDERIASMFLTIGIPAHIKGYHFLREAVKMVLDEPDMINAITKALYPGVAKRYGTSASKVERAIRHSIEVAWTRGRIENFNQVFGCRVFTPSDKPTNGEFIALIADKLSINRTA